MDRLKRAWRWLRLDAHELSTAQRIWFWIQGIALVLSVIGLIAILVWSSMVWESYSD